MLPIGFGSVHMQAPEGIESKFDWTKRHGGQFIEFYYQEMEEAGYGEAEYALLRSLSVKHDLPLTYHISWHKPEDDLGRYSIEEGQKALLKMMEPGFAIGARFLILHLGAYPDGEKRLTVLSRVREIIRSVIPALEEHNAMLCLENNTALYTPGAIGISVFEWDTIFDELDSPHIGMCLDTGHAHVNACLNEMTRVMAEKSAISICTITMACTIRIARPVWAPSIGPCGIPFWRSCRASHGSCLNILLQTAFRRPYPISALQKTNNRLQTCSQNRSC